MADLVLPDGTLADQIRIRLAYESCHGVFDWEKVTPQPFIVDAVLHTMNQGAGERDDLNATINYGEVAAQIEAIVLGDPVDLIETLAERIASACLAWAQAVDVTIHKPKAPVDRLEDVSVRIRRLGPLLARPVRPARVVIALGSNIDPGEHMPGAVAELLDHFPGAQVSETITSTPLESEYGDQDDFHNAVLLADTFDSPLEILAYLQRVERAHRRVREVRWGPRTLDLDLIAYQVDGEDVVSSHPVLTLPHPQAHLRRFVLEPWLSIDPDARLGTVEVRDL